MVHKHEDMLDVLQRTSSNHHDTHLIFEILHWGN